MSVSDCSSSNVNFGGCHCREVRCGVTTLLLSVGIHTLQAVVFSTVAKKGHYILPIPNLALLI